MTPHRETHQSSQLVRIHPSGGETKPSSRHGNWQPRAKSDSTLPAHFTSALHHQHSRTTGLWSPVHTYTFALVWNRAYWCTCSPAAVRTSTPAHWVAVVLGAPSIQEVINQSQVRAHLLLIPPPSLKHFCSVAPTHLVLCQIPLFRPILHGDAQF